MRKGKLQQSVLVRSVFKMLGQKREDAAGPADGEGLVQKMALEGIPSVVIGRTTSGKERILRNGEEVRYLDKPQMDEMYRVGR